MELLLKFENVEINRFNPIYENSFAINTKNKKLKFIVYEEFFQMIKKSNQIHRKGGQNYD